MSVQDGTPAAYLLSRIQFEEIDIAFSVRGQRKYQHVKATRTADAVSIEVSGIPGSLEIPAVRLDSPRLFNAARVDDAADFISRVLDDERNNPVLRYLSDLPGPLYLPLNRRWTEESELPHRRHRRRSTTAGHLPISEVVVLAERVYRQEQAEMFALNGRLRNNILTSLFEVHQYRSVPRVWTLEEVEERRARVVTALGRLGLEDAQEVSEEYFERLTEVVQDLAGETIPSDFQDDPEAFDIWYKWVVEVSPFAIRVERLLPLIEKYETDRLQITHLSNAFLTSVNSFLRDNGKELSFSELDLMVKLPNGQQISSHDLSSGELQLLILFTFLYFQFDADEQFPVFVDEPELSLHVAWQNRYVRTVRDANPSAQFIIATHSPEIAGPAEEALIDISPVT